MSDAADLRKVLERNPGVHQERVTEYLEFERQMRAQGFETRPSYQVTSPLGPLKRKNQNTSASVVQRLVRK
jgi:hypothetical protein